MAVSWDRRKETGEQADQLSAKKAKNHGIRLTDLAKEAYEK